MTDSLRRIRTLALGAAILPALPLAAQAEVMHVKWREASMLTGHTLRISLPGATITCKAGTVEADALVVNVTRTSDPNAYPKGTMRVPRENLHRLEIETKGKAFRALFTSLGGLLGAGLAGLAADGVDGCGPSGCVGGNSAGGHATAAIVLAAGIAGGYFAGNALDKHWEVIEIEP
jgi:hypothetical protein